MTRVEVRDILEKLLNAEIGNLEDHNLWETENDLMTLDRATDLLYKAITYGG